MRDELILLSGHLKQLGFYFTKNLEPFQGDAAVTAFAVDLKLRLQARVKAFQNNYGKSHVRLMKQSLDVRKTTTSMPNPSEDENATDRHIIMMRNPRYLLSRLAVHRKTKGPRSGGDEEVKPRYSLFQLARKEFGR